MIEILKRYCLPHHVRMAQSNFNIEEDLKVSQLKYFTKMITMGQYVEGNDGKLYFLKLFNYAKLHRSAFDSENNLLEIEFLKSIKHPNIVSYKDSGELIFEGKKFGFLVLNFIAGETLCKLFLYINIGFGLYGFKSLSIKDAV
jgi:serine/threonine protein kinase